MSYPGKSPVVYQIKQGNTLYSERHCPLVVTVKDLNYPYQSHCKDLLSYQLLAILTADHECWDLRAKAKVSVKVNAQLFSPFLYKYANT